MKTYMQFLPVMFFLTITNTEGQDDGKLGGKSDF